MRALLTQVDTRSETYAHNRRWFLAKLAELEAALAEVTAGGAYIPGMSDYVVMVKGQARVFLGRDRYGVFRM